MPKIDQSTLPKAISDKYALHNNALVQAVKTDWKDRISAEVGDTKDATTFHPQVKICRWDNEVNFSMRLKHTEKNPTIEFSGEKTKWKGAKVEAHFYDKPEASEDGGHEFEVILKEKPKTNILEFSIETKGLEFFLQPELTDDEAQELATQKGITLIEAKRLMRPENVVDSYAVYYKDCPSNKIYRIDESKYTQDELNQMVVDGTHIGRDNKQTNKVEYFRLGKLYKVGKAFHIYRIKATDANGNWVWGKQNIDVVKKLHTIELSQEFLDKAVYPVVIDPTFGYTSNGASQDSSAAGSTMLGSLYAAPSGNLTIDSFSLYTYMYASTWYYYGLIVNSSLNIISNGKTSWSSAINGKGVPTWTNANFAVTKPVISDAGNYYLCYIVNTPNVRFIYDSGGNSLVDTSNSYSTPTNPTDAVTTGTRKLSIYATYEAGASGPAKLKTWNGLAAAKIKTINGLAIAKVKTINGLV